MGLLILGRAALITTIASVTAAAMSLTQQVHTAQYVDTMSKNVSLTLATQEAIDRKLEMRVDALEEEMATHSSILAWESPWTKGT